MLIRKELRRCRLEGFLKLGSKSLDGNFSGAMRKYFSLRSLFKSFELFITGQRKQFKSLNEFQCNSDLRWTADTADRSLSERGVGVRR